MTTWGSRLPLTKQCQTYADAGEKVKKIKELIRTDNYDAHIARYIPGVLKLGFQGMVEDTDTKEKIANASCKRVRFSDTTTTY